MCRGYPHDEIEFENEWWSCAESKWLNVKYFDSGVMRGVGGMLHGEVSVLRYGETKAWRG